MEKRLLYRWLSAFFLAGYLWLGWNMAGNLSGQSTPAICLFKGITHLPCPSCGTTRALLLLLHGHLQESLTVNPIAVLLLLGMIVIPLWLLVDVACSSDTLYRQFRRAEVLLIRNKWISVPAASAMVLNWIWNIAKGA